jgi:uncharacterized RDD family membrane protein YckC
MSVIKVPTNFNIDVEFEIPEFYRRFIALLIDLIIEYFYYMIANAIYLNLRENSGWDIDSQFNLQAYELLLILPLLIYHLVLEIIMKGQSIGKKIMSIRVVNDIGGRPGISQFFIRWLLRVSDVWIVIILIILSNSQRYIFTPENTFILLAALAFLITDIVLVVSSEKGQRIGDILAKTILIRINTNRNIEDTVFMDVADNYVPSYPQIMQLNDKDINAIKSILETALKKGDYNIAEAASDKIKAHLRIESSLSAFDFLHVLLKDYNYLSTN